MAGQGARPGWQYRSFYWDHFRLVGHDDTYIPLLQPAVPVTSVCLSAGDTNRSSMARPNGQGAAQRVSSTRQTYGHLEVQVGRPRRVFRRDEVPRPRAEGMSERSPK